MGCTKEETANVSSKLHFELKGPKFYSAPQSTPFAEPGYISQIDGVDNEVRITSDLDIETTGVYTIKYSSVNKDGVETHLYRTVGIYSSDVINNDLSGTYTRTDNGQEVHWRKVAIGLYIVDNVAGVLNDADYVYDIYVYNISGNNIDVPLQEDAITGFTDCVEETYDGVGTYSWIVVNSALYGTRTRTFIKSK